MRALLFVHPVWGVGHLTRAHLLAEELSSAFDVTLVLGNLTENVLPKKRAYQVKSITPISAEDAEERDEEKLQKQFEERIEQLKTLSKDGVDLFVTEAFPFSKHYMRRELIPFIEWLREESPHVVVVSSDKGYLQSTKPKDIQLESELLESFDYALIHLDSQLFPKNPRWGEKVHLTGFLYPEIKDGKVKREERVLVTAGSGYKGAMLFDLIKEVSPLFPQLEWVFIRGPLQERFDESALPENLHCVPFSENFIEELQRARFAVTFGGATLFDLSRTKTPGISYASEHSYDQNAIVEFFRKLGVTLPLSELNQIALVDAVNQRLVEPMQVQKTLDLGGLKQSKELILQWVKEKRL